MKSKLNILILACVLLHTHAHAISIVYNFRIAEITKQPIDGDDDPLKHGAIALLFDQYQKKYCGDIRQNFFGGLAAASYHANPYYIRIDFAVSHIHATSKKITTFSGTQTDDILLSFGRNFTVRDQTRLTLSGLFGMPTHAITELKHTSFGYGQVGTGIQLDGSYTWNTPSSFLYGARYIYFVPRNAHDESDATYKFSIGNIGDILVAYKNNLNNHHGIETGYSSRWDFGSEITPADDAITQKTDYHRNNFYAVYKYKFAINDTKNRLLLNIAYGFDSKPKTYGNKCIVTIWASWNIRF